MIFGVRKKKQKVKINDFFQLLILNTVFRYDLCQIFVNKNNKEYYGDIYDYFFYSRIRIYEKYEKIWKIYI